MVVGVRGHAEDLVVQGAENVLVEGIHFCGFVGIGAGSIGGSFLIQVREWTVVHLEDMHDIGQVHD